MDKIQHTKTLKRREYYFKRRERSLVSVLLEDQYKVSKREVPDKRMLVAH